MLERDFKNKVVRVIRGMGGYARRVEDQFAVGLPDMIVIPKGSPHVFFVEAKRIKGNVWGCTPRQQIELERINNALNPNAIGLMLGLHEETGDMYVWRPSTRADRRDCRSCSNYSDIPNLFEAHARAERP